MRRNQTSPDQIERLRLAKTLAKEAAEALRSMSVRELERDAKSDGSIVTSVDRQIESFLIDGIRSEYPNDGIIGEESGVEPERDSRYTWTVDPIDGTESFVLGLPFFSTLIGLLESGKPVAGVAEFPKLNERIFALASGGVYHQKDVGSESVARAKDSDQLDQALLVYTSTDDLIRVDWVREALRRLSRHVGYHNPLGDAYGFMLVATGRAEVMVDYGVAPWDIAPMMPIVQQSGALMTTWSGAPIEFAGTHNQRFDVVAACRGLHPKVVEILGLNPRST